MPLFASLAPSLQALAHQIEQGERLTAQQATELMEQAPLWLLSLLATRAKERHSGRTVFYNRNFHLEPSNVCLYHCRFCSYRRSAESPEAWNYTIEELLEQVEAHRAGNPTEVHIVGGVHPNATLESFEELIRAVHERIPEASIKAFTAIELLHVIEQAGVTTREGLERLQAAGMRAIPGGGAEIFAPHIRDQICPEKGSAERWLSLHETAHTLGIPTNATILYGHIESLADRIDHLERLRSLQDRTHGFDALIPLKYRSRNNLLGVGRSEVSVVEDMRMMALTRLYLDNVPHIKAYWPMFGKQSAQLALAFGADDLDGTINDSTRIYSAADVEEQRPEITTEALEAMIRSAGYEPAERDTFYNLL